MAPAKRLSSTGVKTIGVFSDAFNFLRKKCDHSLIVSVEKHEHTFMNYLTRNRKTMTLKGNQYVEVDGMADNQ